MVSEIKLTYIFIKLKYSPTRQKGQEPPLITELKKIVENAMVNLFKRVLKVINKKRSKSA